MLFHSTVMCMEKTPYQKASYEQQQKIRELVGDKADYIFIFGREDKPNPEHMLLLGKWLTEQRNNTPETTLWNAVVDYLDGSVDYCRCVCRKNQRTAAVAKIVRETAYALNPGEDCAQLLADRAQDALQEFDISEMVEAFM